MCQDLLIFGHFADYPRNWSSTVLIPPNGADSGQLSMYLIWQVLILTYCQCFSDEHSSKVKSFMLDVLCPLITESDIVSNELLDIILMNIVEPIKSTRKNSYLLAKDLVIKCSDTLEPYIQAVSKDYNLFKFLLSIYLVFAYTTITILLVFVALLILTYLMLITTLS